jgi:hypothetical protein
VDSQLTTLQGSGADVLVVAAAPKFAGSRSAKARSQLEADVSS